MANITENLHVILKEKNDLKNSINAKNAGAITDSTPFSAYPESISAIEARSLDMSDRVVSDCLELNDYTDSVFKIVKCIKEVNIPTNVTSLSDNCFRSCSSLTGITISDSVTSLGEYCFNGCSSLMDITIPNSVTSIPKYCFNYCSRLTSVTIPDSVTSLITWCFAYCGSLSAVTISDSVTSIGDGCFQGCSSLTCIIIPKYVTSLGKGCFAYSNNLASVTCKATTPPTLGSNAFKITHSELVIYVPAESVDAYKSATNWSEYADKIQAIA